MSASELLQIFLMSERIRQLRMRALIHQRISSSARQRAKRLTMIYLATVARERTTLQALPPIKVFTSKEMTKLSEEDYLEKFHISKASFWYILDKLSFHLCKRELRDTPLWKQIAVSLYILATTDSLKSIGEMFGMERSSVIKVFLEFCYGINLIFQEEYMKGYPPTAEGISTIRNGFETASGLSQAYGAVGVYHVDVKESDKRARTPVQILVVADHRNKFTYVEIGQPGDNSNMFERSALKDYHKCNKLFYSMSRKLGGTSVPMFLIGDASFHLQPFLMTPFQHANLSPQELYFNSVLLKTHLSVENAFAQVKKRFPRIETCKDIQVDVIPILTKTLCIMHNILLERNDLLQESITIDTIPPITPNAIDEDGMGMTIRDEIAKDLFSCYRSLGH